MWREWAHCRDDAEADHVEEQEKKSGGYECRLHHYIGDQRCDDGGDEHRSAFSGRLSVSSTSANQLHMTHVVPDPKEHMQEKFHRNAGVCIKAGLSRASIVTALMAEADPPSRFLAADLADPAALSTAPGLT